MEVLINGKWKLQLPEWRAKFYRDHNGSWESERLDEMFSLVKPGMVIYDVGAEHGDFTALYKLWGGDVIPIEPSPPYWGIIREIWEMNFKDQPSACFSGFASNVDKFGDVDFSRYPDEAMCKGIPEFGFRHLAQQADSTPQIKLDTLAKHTKAPDIVVIDTEGSEYDVLLGAVELMKKKPIMFVSIHEPTLMEWYGKTPDDIHNLMESFGYTKKFIGREIEDFWVYI